MKNLNYSKGPLRNEGFQNKTEAFSSFEVSEGQRFNFKYLCCILMMYLCLHNYMGLWRLKNVLTITCTTCRLFTLTRELFNVQASIFFLVYFFPKWTNSSCKSHSQSAPPERQARSVQLRHAKSSDVASRMWVELAVVRAIDEAFSTANRSSHNSFRMATRLQCIVPLRIQCHMFNNMSLNGSFCSAGREPGLFYSSWLLSIIYWHLFCGRIIFSACKMWSKRGATRL